MLAFFGIIGMAACAAAGIVGVVSIFKKLAAKDPDLAQQVRNFAISGVKGWAEKL